MIFFDLFRSRKKQPSTVEIRHINLTGRGIEADGELLDLPVHIAAAKQLNVDSNCVHRHHYSVAVFFRILKIILVT